MDPNNMRNNNNPENGGQKGDGTPPKKQSLLFLLLACLMTLLCMSYFMKALNSATTRPVAYDTFVKMLKDGVVESVYITDDKIDIYTKEKEPETEEELLPSFFPSAEIRITYYTGKAESDDVLSQRLLKAGVKIEKEIPDSSGFLMSMILTYIVPMLLVWFLLSPCWCS